MLNFILVVYVASATASFQTMGPFDTMAACDSMKSQMAENFKDIKSACLSMNTQSLQSIASKYDSATPAKTSAKTQANYAEPVPLPKPRPRITLAKKCKDNSQIKPTE